MVKTKSSKSTIAIVVLALLLIASLVLGMTGAWFTDSKDGSGTGGSITLGEVSLNAGAAGVVFKSGETTITEKLVAGDKAEVSGTITYTGDVGAYIKGVASVVVKHGDTVLYDSSLETQAEDYGIVVTGADLSVLGSATDKTGMYQVAAPTTENPATAKNYTINIQFPQDNEKFDAFNGSEQNITVTVSAKFAAVQSANITTTQAEAELNTLLGIN